MDRNNYYRMPMNYDDPQQPPYGYIQPGLDGVIEPQMYRPASMSPHSSVVSLLSNPQSGIPVVAPASRFTAPVHIDVGGTIYTSSLETLTAYSNSRLAKMFNGNIPIVLDSLKQHYFIDRDGDMFRHILNYLRNGCLVLPNNFPALDLLLQEAIYFDIKPLVLDIQKRKEANYTEDYSDIDSLSSPPPRSPPPPPPHVQLITIFVENERRYLFTCPHDILMEVFPEIMQGVPAHILEAHDQICSLPLSDYVMLQFHELLPIMITVGFQLNVMYAHSNGVQYELTRVQHN